jgi:hypothetical protein
MLPGWDAYDQVAPALEEELDLAFQAESVPAASLHPAATEILAPLRK